MKTKMLSRILFALPVLTILLLTSFVKPAKKSGIQRRTPFYNRVIAEGAANPYTIIIDKSDYELQVFDDTGWLYTYPVVFGSKDLGDKMMEGDKKTPEGEFKVQLKKNQ